MSLKGKLLVPESLAGGTLGRKSMVDDDDLVATQPVDDGNQIWLEDVSGFVLMENSGDILLE